MADIDIPVPPAPRRGGRAVSPPARSARRTLSRGAIVDTALALLDAEGLAAVTMRRVAGELDTGPASLYAHFADKEEMVAALLDRVLGEIPLPDPIDPKRWQEQLKQLLRDVRATFGRHRDIAFATLGTVPVGENALHVSNAMVGIMLAGRVPDQVASYGVDILSLYSGAVAYEESLELHAPGDEREDYHDQLRGFFDALPAARFPHLVALAGPLTAGTGDERFEFGLDLLVRGLASAKAPKHATP